MGNKTKRIVVNVLIIIGALGGLVLGALILNEDFRSTIDAELIYEEKVSPNEEYVESKSQVILYKIQVYQKKDNNIIIKANSNWTMFEAMKFEIEHNEKISNSDVKITWGTLMGDQNFAKDNQMIKAKVELLSNGQVFHKEVVNYAENLFKTIEGTMKH